MAKLIVKLGAKVVREIFINKPSIKIGRLEDNDIVLADNLSSRHHCDIIQRDNKYIANDLKSANGTMVNKKKISSHTLQENDEIQIGSYSIIFNEGSNFVVPGSGGSPFGATTRTAAPGAPPLPGSDIVKRITDIDASYQINIKDIFDKGESLSASAMAGMEEGKAGKKFFLLYQLGKAVATTNSLNEVLDVALSSVFDFIKAERGVILLLNNATKELVPAISRTLKTKSFTDHIKVSQTITNKAVQDKVSLITSDAQADSRFSAGMSIAQQNIRSALCVPLWDKEDVLGVIYVDNSMRAHSFTNDDLDLMTAIANQIAIRIKQEELYDKLKKEALVRSNLERYHSPDVAEMIISQGVTLDVQEKDITVLFADIQNFTTLSEQLHPSEIAAMLNNFFDVATNLVFEYKGSINKYIGDAVMAIFGAPVLLPDHPARAVMASVKMMEALTTKKYEIPYNLRIGINTGMVVAGNVGSKQRIEYTVLGDTVNVASRLNQYGKAMEVVIGEETYKRIKDLGLPLAFTNLGTAKLKGKEKEVQVYKAALTTQPPAQETPPPIGNTQDKPADK
jgi:adenylate cyclase